MDTRLTDNVTSGDLLAELEIYLESDECTDSGPSESLADVSRMVEDTLGAINAVMQKQRDLLTSPLSGDAQERYSALLAARSEYDQAWRDISRLADAVSYFGNRWRQDNEQLSAMIKCYAVVFGFTLPDELKSSAPGGDNPFADEMAPF